MFFGCDRALGPVVRLDTSDPKLAPEQLVEKIYAQITTRTMEPKPS